MKINRQMKMKMKMKMNVQSLLFPICCTSVKEKEEGDAAISFPPQLPFQSPVGGSLEDPNLELNRKMSSLEERMKLCLIVNLDNALLDSINWDDMTKEDNNYLSNSAVQDSCKEGQFVVLDQLKKTTKLRPHIKTFFERLTQLYDMVLYSMGSPAYVQTIRKVLDPDGYYSRNGSLMMISDEDNQRTRRVEAVLSHPRTFLILDDREDVWKNYSKNLIKIPPYNYFGNNKKKFAHKTWSQLKGDECEEGGELFRVLRSLRTIYYNFLHAPMPNQDVREVVHMLRVKNIPLDSY